MWRAVAGLILAFLFTALIAEAQQTDSLRRATDSLRQVNNLRRMDSLRRADSLRRDSIKIDTNLLNRYRIGTARNALSQRLRPVQIYPELIPVTMLDYKISYWHKAVILGINFNQSGFSNNWAGGSVNSFALGGNLDYKLEYNKQPFVYTTQLILLYGRSKNRGQLSRKTNDRVFWDNKIATQLSKTWFFFGSVNFESQFDRGFNYDANPGPLTISRFMSPGYVTESLGFEYKPNSSFDLRIGTGTARQTFVLDTTIYRNRPGNYGVTPRRTFKNELAFQAVALYDKEIMSNLRLTSRYSLFIPYGRSLKNIDHRWDVTIAAKVNRLIAVTITGVALLDKDTSPAIQGNENLALGIIYRFP
jgi:hypothetical protein